MIYLLLVLGFVLLLLLDSTKENFVDFGFSGWKKPVDRLALSYGSPVNLSGYKRDLTVLSSTQIGGIIDAMMKAGKKATKMCLDPIETIYINKYSGEDGDIYDSRVMFYSKDHYFAVELIGQVKSEGNGYRVVSLRTQRPANDANGPTADSLQGFQAASFTPYDDMLKKVSPSKSAMEAVLKTL